MKSDRIVSDRRVRRTQKALRENLLILLGTTPINRVSVSKLCEMADINRSTFYTYYASPLDLLETMEEEFFEEDDSGTDDLAQVEKICDRIYRHRSLSRIMFGPHGDITFLCRQLDFTRERWLGALEKNMSDMDRCQVEYAFSFLLNGSLGILQQWIRDDFTEPPAFIARLIYGLSDSALHIPTPG